MKKLRFVIFVMLIMLLLCSAARAVRPAPEALPGQIKNLLHSRRFSICIDDRCSEQILDHFLGRDFQQRRVVHIHLHILE